MAYYDYETLDDATRAYIDQVFLDEGKQLPVSFARIASSSMLIIFVSALILIGCYWFLFYPPLGNPLKETLIAMAFFFPSIWFLWIAIRSMLKFDRNYRSPKFCFADGSALWICKGSTVNHIPLKDITGVEIQATEKKVTVCVSEGNNKSTSIYFDPSTVDLAMSLKQFLDYRLWLASGDVLTDITDTHAIGRRVMMARGLYDYCTSDLNQNPEQIFCMPQAFILTGPSVEPEPGQEKADTPIHLVIPWHRADTTAWRSLAAKQLDVAGEPPATDDPAFGKATDLGVDRPTTSILFPALAICLSLPLLFYIGLYAIIFVRDGAIMEIIQGNGFPPDQMRAYLADERNIRYRHDLLQRLIILYSIRLAPLKANLKNSNPVLGPEFVSMTESLAFTPQPLWSMTISGPNANEIGISVKNNVQNMLNLGTAQGVVWTDPPESVAPHFLIVLEQQAGDSIAVSVRLTRNPAEPNNSASATWNARSPDVTNTIIEQLTGQKPAPAAPANPMPAPVRLNQADKQRALQELIPKDVLNKLINEMRKENKAVADPEQKKEAKSKP